MKVAILSLSLLLISVPSLASDKDDVMAVIQRYAALEGDLEAQGALIRDDRVQIAPTRWTDNASYMAWQAKEREHREKLNGGPAEMIVDVESPVVRVFGNAAVVSFVRRQMILPPGHPPVDTSPLWQTVVLAKERGEWKIAHTHVSPVGDWN